MAQEQTREMKSLLRSACVTPASSPPGTNQRAHIHVGGESRPEGGTIAHGLVGQTVQVPHHFLYQHPTLHRHGFVPTRY